ncbi:hypothetical protein RZE82_00535 [Mollicutes bacterium LVI A0039]|nr:hypothetical protein RZE82_00535 [Mollicutes bacterium LVI A0039]
MKNYIFNTNFVAAGQHRLELVKKQKDYMINCDGQIIITSNRSLYNYNDYLEFTEPHVKSLCYGLYIENSNGKIKVDNHFPKTKALFIGSMWKNEDIYIVANNGFFTNGSHFNYFLKTEDNKNSRSLYELDKIYIIYIKGDMTDNILLQDYIVEYNADTNTSMITFYQIKPEQILNYISGYSYGFSDLKEDTLLLNSVNEGYAIGNNFNLASLNDNVEHVDQFFFVNKYIENMIKGTAK